MALLVSYVCNFATRRRNNSRRRNTSCRQLSTRRPPRQQRAKIQRTLKYKNYTTTLRGHFMHAGYLSNYLGVRMNGREAGILRADGFAQTRASVARYSREMMKMRAMAKINAKKNQPDGNDKDMPGKKPNKTGRAAYGGVASLLQSLSNHSPKVWTFPDLPRQQGIWVAWR